jgi:methylated-DNA-[protein]-cysteine S-methyltransferase
MVKIMKTKSMAGAPLTLFSCRLESPLGPLSLFFSPRGLAALAFAEEAADLPADCRADSALTSAILPLVTAAREELVNYFRGRPADFRRLTLDLQGTPFQKRVWRELQRIPHGQPISYKELARRAGSPKAFRAVGQANALNPIPIIVPCHRVIAADGSLGGYSSGLDRKRWLLKHEGCWRDNL